MGVFFVKAQDFIVKPYVQVGYHPTPTSLDLLWHAKDVDADWSVEWSNTPNGPWVKTGKPTSTKIAAANIPAHRVYRAQLTGLTSGKKFYYHVLVGNNAVFTSESQASKTQNQSYRFVAMGDIGAETGDQKKLALQAYLAKPDYVVVPGDIVYENGLISQYRSKFWPIYNADKADTNGAPIMRSVPFIASVGNHDADSRDLDLRPDGLAYFLYWDQPLNGPDAKEGGPLTPVLKASEANRKPFIEAAGLAYPNMTNFSYNYGNAHWIILDSNPYTDWTDKGLQAWIAKDLEDSKDATWHFVLFHHPGFNSSREHYEQQHMRLLSPVFEKGKVDIVFNGHVHNYQRSFPMTFKPDNNGTLMVGGRDMKSVRGRIVNGAWKLDKEFDGKTKTVPNGIIYLVTGAGGQDLYNPEQEKDADSWQKFTDKFVSTVHTITVVDVEGKKLTFKQIDTNGKVKDAFVVTKK